MERKYDPMAYSEAVWWADLAKKMKEPEVKEIQRNLLRRIAEVGVASPDVLEIISGMTDRFIDEEMAMRRELMAEELRRKGSLSQGKIDADDDQIVQAIKWTLPKFQSDWDWGGIYIILVNFCNHLGFSAVKTKFVERMAQMGVYPQDKVVKVEHVANTAIIGTEWHEHRFSYLALQRGVKSSWPQTWNEWQNSVVQSKDFLARREIAKLFLSNLRKATKES